MTVRISALNSAEAADPRMHGTVSELVAAVALLTAEAWRVAGRSLPQYTRATMPIVITTLGDRAGT